MRLGHPLLLLLAVLLLLATVAAAGVGGAPAKGSALRPAYVNRLDDFHRLDRSHRGSFRSRVTTSRPEAKVLSGTLGPQPLAAILPATTFRVDGAPGVNVFSRGLLRARVREGESVVLAACSMTVRRRTPTYLRLLSIDNFSRYGRAGNLIGVYLAPDGELRMTASTYSGSWTGFDVGTGRRMAPGGTADSRMRPLVLRITLGSDRGQALTELWADGELLAQTTEPNTFDGRPMRTSRFGISAVNGARANRLSVSVVRAMATPTTDQVRC